MMELEEDSGPWMTLRTSLLWLGLITCAISSLSDVIVDTIDGFAYRSKLSEVFTSIIIIPFFSNIAEQVSAVIFAFRNKMDLCIGVTVGSAAQVALFILPGTVLVGWYMDRPMSLYFQGYEVCCLLLSVICVGSVLQGGSTNWMSGFICIGIYWMIASGFSFHVDERLSWETQMAKNSTRSLFYYRK
jgi:Ca2+:H+ antiporter